MGSAEISIKYENLQKKFDKIKKDFESYEKFANDTIGSISRKNVILEKKLDSMSNIIEISKYINSNISNDNLIPMINDMIIGILGVSYSSIYLKENDKLILKATNIPNNAYEVYHRGYRDKIEKGEFFVISYGNSSDCKNHTSINISSIAGVPVVLAQKYIGYIIIEHSTQDFFSDDDIKFITSIANQIAIALENSILYKKVRENSIKDALLEIYNRGYFFEILKNSIINNPNKNFAIVMLDADNFKKVNDEHGHQFGDEALHYIAKTIVDNIDKNDIAARYGGEELIIYIDDVQDREMVFNKVDSIRKKISGNPLKHNDKDITISASFGISYYDEQHRNLIEVLNTADMMLYQAKSSGKNIVISV